MDMLESALVPLAVIIGVVAVILGLNHAEFRAVFRRRQNPAQRREEKLR